jgi:acyl-CoA thioesterase FadM
MVRAFSLPPTEMVAREYMIVVVETHLQHKRPARYDEELQIEVWSAPSG